MLSYVENIYRSRQYLFDIWYTSCYGYTVDDYDIHNSICLYYCSEEEEENVDNTQ